MKKLFIVMLLSTHILLSEESQKNNIPKNENQKTFESVLQIFENELLKEPSTAKVKTVKKSEEKNIKELFNKDLENNIDDKSIIKNLSTLKIEGKEESLNNIEAIKKANPDNKFIQNQIDRLPLDENGNFIPTPKQQKVVNAALSLLGRRSLRFPKVRFNWDCSGTVMASYFFGKVDNALKDYINAVGNSGVKKIYHMLESNLYKNKLPSPGDTIFWDNTYDKNHNKKWDDTLTHIAVVVKVNKSGLITYVHHNYRKGIIIGYMDLKKPSVYKENGKVLNSPMRMKSQIYLNPSKWLSSHLFRGFAKLY